MEKKNLTIEAINSAFQSYTTLKARAILSDAFSKSATVCGTVEDVLKGRDTLPGCVTVILKEAAYPSFEVRCDFITESDRETHGRLLDLKRGDVLTVSGELGFYAPNVLSLRDCRFSG